MLLQVRAGGLIDWEFLKSVVNIMKMKSEGQYFGCRRTHNRKLIMLLKYLDKNGTRDVETHEGVNEVKPHKKFYKGHRL